MVATLFPTSSAMQRMHDPYRLATACLEAGGAEATALAICLTASLIAAHTSCASGAGVTSRILYTMWYRSYRILQGTRKSAAGIASTVSRIFARIDLMKYEPHSSWAISGGAIAAVSRRFVSPEIIAAAMVSGCTPVVGAAAMLLATVAMTKATRRAAADASDVGTATATAHIASMMAMVSPSGLVAFVFLAPGKMPYFGCSPTSHDDRSRASSCPWCPS